ncbi:MAG: VacJ family lipoprotein [Oceanicaulis sp.]
MRFFSLTIAALSAVAASACASSDAAREAGDPFEPANRAVFQFNETVDDALIEPASKAYTAVTPEPARQGVRNFFGNLNRPVFFANEVLQGDLVAAGDVLTSFAFDTVFGIGGIFALAERAGVPQHSEDFGQTLAVWGVAEGPFLMLPVLGPSNLRDGTGRFVDRYPHPLNWDEEFSSSGEAWALRGLNGIDQRARAQSVMDQLDRTAIDPYVQLRSAYRQMREREIRDGAPSEEDFDDLPDFD